MCTCTIMCYVNYMYTHSNVLNDTWIKFSEVVVYRYVSWRRVLCIKIATPEGESVCVCVREGERERESEVGEGGRKRETEKVKERRR